MSSVRVVMTRIVCEVKLYIPMCHHILLIIILSDLVGKLTCYSLDINLTTEHHTPFKNDTHASLVNNNNFVFTCRADGKTSVGTGLVLMVSPVKLLNNYS